MVRGLAGGVLGAKTPAPAPLKPGLAQELVWDGKGDWNLPVESGPFRVRVRAGMGAGPGIAGTRGDPSFPLRCS